MTGLPPVDTHDRAQRASRVVPFDNDPNSLWDLAAAGLVTSLEVDERGLLSPAPSPDVQIEPAFARPPTGPSPTATQLLPFERQRGPFEDDRDDDDRDDNRRDPGYTTPPPKRPPTSPPPLKRKHARAALGEVSNKVLRVEVKALEKDSASLQRENAHLKKQCRLQENVIVSFCALELARHERRR